MILDSTNITIITIIIIIIVGLYFYMRSEEFEGFTVMEGGKEKVNSFVTKFIPKRGDVGTYDEEKGFQRDPRFFAGYADIQRLGVKNDFCRMVQPEGSNDPQKAFFACALAGTENLSGTEFRTETVKEGFQRSRDDYMRDVTAAGREDYCRILKASDGTFQPMCRRALDRHFGKKDILDPRPPKPIQTLLDFYDGVIMWLRMRDDLVDYAGNLLIATSGDLKIDETPNLSITEGLRFDGVNQFLRLGENYSMEFGDTLSIRMMRAVSLWVYFDEFTNNAHIFDFGSGEGNNNVFLGIVGRGNPTMDRNAIRQLLCEDKDTVPAWPSGAQPPQEMSPQKLMKISSANVDEFSCEGFEVEGRRMKPLRPKALPPKGDPATADLIYEVWDSKQRKMRMKIPNAVKLKTWTHIAITADSMDAFRPNLDVYINGRFVFKHPNGFLPQTSFTSHNYIGKSNWANATSQFENRDELFKGSIFDFRAYNKVMGSAKVAETAKWGAALLGIPMPAELAQIQKEIAKDKSILPSNELSNAAPLIGTAGAMIFQETP